MHPLPVPFPFDFKSTDQVKCVDGHSLPGRKTSHAAPSLGSSVSVPMFRVFVIRICNQVP